jgi:hypothetical protein
MHNINSVIGNRKLKYVTMPGSHDAGMHVFAQRYGGASAGDTVTQIVNVYGQLLAGSRWLDLRPCQANNGQLYMCHLTVSNAAVEGGLGQTVAEVIDNVNQFMSDHPGELVILDINSDAGYDLDECDIVEVGTCAPRLSQDQWNNVASKFLHGLKNQCDHDSNPYTSLSERTINSIMSYDTDQGCVLPVFRLPYTIQNTWNRGGLPRTSFASGKDAVESMGPDQVTHLKQSRVLGQAGASGTKDDFFLLSWTLDAGIFSISDAAADAYAVLANWAYDQFTPYSYPNVLFLDFVGAPWDMDAGGRSEQDMEGMLAWDLAYLAMAVNIQVAGANCWVAANSANMS